MALIRRTPPRRPNPSLRSGEPAHAAAAPACSRERAHWLSRWALQLLQSAGYRVARRYREAHTALLRPRAPLPRWPAPAVRPGKSAVRVVLLETAAGRQALAVAELLRRSRDAHWGRWAWHAPPVRKRVVNAAASR